MNLMCAESLGFQFQGTLYVVNAYRVLYESSCLLAEDKHIPNGNWFQNNARYGHKNVSLAVYVVVYTTWQLQDGK